MSNDFEKSLAFVLKHETEFEKGHYGDMDFVRTEHDPHDAGGTTRFGIDQRSHEGVDIDKLTVEQATQIYRKDYWGKGNCQELPWPISLAHFDGCVNVGINRATKILQEAVGANSDGSFGPATKRALIEACNKSSPRDIAEKISQGRRTYYCNLASKRPEMERYLNGWLNRCTDLSISIV